MRFSYSQVHLYEDNPWKHFCNYVMHLYPPQSDAAERGTDVHGTFEILAQLDKSTNYIEYVDKMHEKEELSDETWTIVRRYLINYSGLGRGLLGENRLPWKDAVKVECEKKVTTTFDGVDFVGYIDLVVYHKDGSVTLYDYKTLSNKPSVYEYTSGMQGNLYIRAMENLGFKVNQFIFDAMNPKMKIPWNGYRFFRIEVANNKLRVDNAVKRFVHLANEIIKNPSYYNTFRGWDDELHNNAWNAFNKSPEDFYMFCKNNGVNVEQVLGESINKGYPLPWFFVLDGEENEISSVEDKLENSKSIDIVKVAVNNRKKLENWTDEDIIHDDLQFDYLILGNHNGWRQFNKDYTEVKLFSDEEIESLDMGHNIRKSI